MLETLKSFMPGGGGDKKKDNRLEGAEGSQWDLYVAAHAAYERTKQNLADVQVAIGEEKRKAAADPSQPNQLGRLEAEKTRLQGLVGSSEKEYNTSYAKWSAEVDATKKMTLKDFLTSPYLLIALAAAFPFVVLAIMGTMPFGGEVAILPVIPLLVPGLLLAGLIAIGGVTVKDWVQGGIQAAAEQEKFFDRSSLKDFANCFLIKRVVAPLLIITAIVCAIGFQVPVFMMITSLAIPLVKHIVGKNKDGSRAGVAVKAGLAIGTTALMTNLMGGGSLSFLPGFLRSMLTYSFPVTFKSLGAFFATLPQQIGVGFSALGTQIPLFFAGVAAGQVLPIIVLAVLAILTIFVIYKVVTSIMDAKKVAALREEEVEMQNVERRVKNPRTTELEEELSDLKQLQERLAQDPAAVDAPSEVRRLASRLDASLAGQTAVAGANPEDRELVQKLAQKQKLLAALKTQHPTLFPAEDEDDDTADDAHDDDADNDDDADDADDANPNPADPVPGRDALPGRNPNFHANGNPNPAQIGAQKKQSASNSQDVTALQQQLLACDGQLPSLRSAQQIEQLTTQHNALMAQIRELSLTPEQAMQVQNEDASFVEMSELMLRPAKQQQFQQQQPPQQQQHAAHKQVQVGQQPTAAKPTAQSPQPPQQNQQQQQQNKPQAAAQNPQQQQSQQLKPKQQQQEKPAAATRGRSKKRDVIDPSAMKRALTPPRTAEASAHQTFLAQGGGLLQEMKELQGKLAGSNVSNVSGAQKQELSQLWKRYNDLEYTGFRGFSPENGLAFDQLKEEMAQLRVHHGQAAQQSQPQQQPPQQPPAPLVQTVTKEQQKQGAGHAQIQQKMPQPHTKREVDGKTILPVVLPMKPQKGTHLGFNKANQHQAPPANGQPQNAPAFGNAQMKKNGGLPPVDASRSLSG